MEYWKNSSHYRVTVVGVGVDAFSTTPITVTLSTRRPLCHCFPVLTRSSWVSTFYFGDQTKTSFAAPVDLQRLRKQGKKTQALVEAEVLYTGHKKLVGICELDSFLDHLSDQGFVYLWRKGEIILKLFSSLLPDNQDARSVSLAEEVMEETSGNTTCHVPEEAAVVPLPSKVKEKKKKGKGNTVHQEAKVNVTVKEEKRNTDSLSLSTQKQATSSPHTVPSISRPPPWVSPPSHYDGTLRALHQEVEDFHRWASGSEEDTQRRWRTVEDLRVVVSSLWPEASVEATGSLASGLFLPDSDVDVTLLGHLPPSPMPLFALRDALTRQGLARPGTLTVLDKATVPLVKFVHKSTGLDVDVSLGNEAAVRAADLIRELIRRFPGLAPLSVLVRFYLRGLGLSEVYRGGVSSYSVTLMAASLMQLRVRREDQDNFGLLTVDFFHFYGYEFSYRSVGISVLDGGRYLRKEELPVVMPGGHRRADLCIQDPITPTNDVGRSSYRIWDVRMAFQHAYRVLVPAVVESGAHTLPVSLLGRLLAGRDKPTPVLRSGFEQQQRRHHGATRRPARRGRGRSGG